MAISRGAEACPLDRGTCRSGACHFEHASGWADAHRLSQMQSLKRLSVRSHGALHPLLPLNCCRLLFFPCRRVKYVPFPAAVSSRTSPRSWFPDRATVRLYLRQAFGQGARGESSPLLSGNVI